jgi:dynactin complex subunit
LAVGKHDGEVEGQRYFTCKPKCGLFTKAETTKITTPKLGFKSLLGAKSPAKTPLKPQNKLKLDKAEEPLEEEKFICSHCGEHIQVKICVSDPSSCEGFNIATNFTI